MSDSEHDPDNPEGDLSNYAGRWVASLGGRVIAQGGMPQQAYQTAKASRYKENPQVFYVPTTSPLAFHPLFERVQAVLPTDIPTHIVGGAVRDALLSKPSHDLDFILPRSALQIARQIADAIGARYYPLDEERNYGRVILSQPEGKPIILDFAVYQGQDLESDLRARDFTINAMAVDALQPQALLDPLGGAADLHAKQIRACTPQSIAVDPIRILRGVRLAATLNFHILPETREAMRQASPLLTRVSSERLRDELFRILESPRLSAAIKALEILGVLPYTLPELLALKGVAQSPPHISDVWAHTLDVVQKLTSVLDVLRPEHDPDLATNLHLGFLAMRLGRFREQIFAHLENPITPNRTLRPLLFLAALYHDIGKPTTWQTDKASRIRFIEHDRIGAELTSRRAHILQLSNVEIARLNTIVRHHMRPLLLMQGSHPPTRRAIYRFFRDTGEAGVDICLLSLADVLATFGPTLNPETWASHLEIVRTFLQAWWENPTLSVSPLPFLTGTDLMTEFEIKPGPKIGKLLDSIREAQATGQVNNREEALAFAQQMIEDINEG